MNHAVMVDWGEVARDKGAVGLLKRENLAIKEARMVTASWVLFDLIVVVWTSFLTRKLSTREKIVIAIIGIGVAIYGGYSEHQDSVLMSSLKTGQDFARGQLDSISKILGSKLALSPDANAAAIASAAATKIDTLQRRLEQHEWPLVKDEKRASLVSAFKSVSPKTLVIFCNDDDCIPLAEDINKIAADGGWHSRILDSSYDGLGTGLAFYGSGSERASTDILGKALQAATNAAVQTGSAGPMPENSDYLIVVGRKPREFGKNGNSN